jgi:hypothetical protein
LHALDRGSVVVFGVSLLGLLADFIVIVAAFGGISTVVSLILIVRFWLGRIFLSDFTVELVAERLTG